MSRKLKLLGAGRIWLPLLLLVLCAANPGFAQDDHWRTLNTRVENLFEQRKYAEALPIAEESLRDAERDFGPTDSRVAISLQNLAYLHVAQNDFAGAEPMAQRALIILETVRPPNPRLVGEAFNTLSQIYEQVQRFPEAESYAMKALAIQQKALPPDDPDLGVSLANLATMYFRQFKYPKYAEAEEYYKRAIAIFEKAGGPDRGQLAKTLGELARFYFMSGRNAEAVPLLRREVALLESILGPDRPEVLVEREMLASCQSFSKQYAGAEQTYKRILATELVNIGPNRASRIAEAYDQLGQLQHLQGKDAQAEQSTLQAVQEIEKGLSPQDPRIEQPLEHLVGIYKDEKKYATAEQTDLRLLAVTKKIDPRDVHVVMILEELVKLAEQQGHYAESAPYHVQIIAFWDKSTEPGAAIGAREGYAALLRKLNRNDEAAAVNAQAKELSQKQEFAKLTDADITEIKTNLIMLELEALQKGFGPGYDRVADSLTNYAAILRFKGRTVEAKEIEARAQSMRDRTDYAGPESFAQWYLEVFDRTLRVRGNASISAPTIDGLNRLAGLLRKLNRPSDAAQLRARANEIRTKTSSP